MIGKPARHPGQSHGVCEGFGPEREKVKRHEIEIVVKDGVARCTCNGELLEEALKVPPTGPIGLEADVGQMEYRRIRLKELP